jgi:hypothetical protein
MRDPIMHVVFILKNVHDSPVLTVPLELSFASVN